MDENVRKIMAILNDELEKEIKCKQIALSDMKRIRNPIKKLKAKRAVEMFVNHVGALKFAIIRIERELKLKNQ